MDRFSSFARENQNAYKLLNWWVFIFCGSPPIDKMYTFKSYKFLALRLPSKCIKEIESLYPVFIRSRSELNPKNARLYGKIFVSQNKKGGLR